MNDTLKSELQSLMFETADTMRAELNNMVGNRKITRYTIEGNTLTVWPTATLESVQLTFLATEADYGDVV